MLNDIEQKIATKMNKIKHECEEDLYSWTVEKLKEYKKQNNKKVELLSGMGTWLFIIDGKDNNEISDFFELDENKILKEINDTLGLMAGEHEIYLINDIKLP